MKVFKFTPAEATFVATVIGKMRYHEGPSGGEYMLNRLELRFQFPNDLQNFGLNPNERACLVEALRTFSTRASDSEQRQADDLIKRLSKT